MGILLPPVEKRSNSVLNEIMKVLKACSLMPARLVLCWLEESNRNHSPIRGSESMDSRRGNEGQTFNFSFSPAQAQRPALE